MKTVHVAVGVIIDQQRRVLVALRSPDAHQGGLWEFPGGKCEAGETVEQSLRRELAEELGIEVTDSAALCQIRHDYGDKAVLLEVRRVLHFTGEPRGLEGQAVRWVAVQALQSEEFPAANRAIIQRIQLADRIAISAPVATSDALGQLLAGLLAQNLPIIHLRQPQLPAQELAARLPEWLAQCRARGTLLVLNTTPQRFLQAPVDGLHINSQIAAALRARPIASQYGFSVSCHSLAQLQHARDIGADYAFLSPVAATKSHPDSVPMGWDRFAALTSAVDLPVYALGGMGLADIASAYRHGGVGIAAISAFLPTL